MVKRAATGIFLGLALVGWGALSLRGMASAASEGPPQRIVSLALSLTEILFALGLEDRVVGVTDFCDYPEPAKGTNVAGDSRVRYPKYSLEAILRRDPQVIFLPGRHRAGPNLLPAQDAAQPWRQWPGISAVRQGRIHAVNDTVLIRPGPRIAQGLELLARILHPALFGKDAGAKAQNARSLP